MSKNDLRYILARESALQMLIFAAVGFGYELVRLACPRNPTERNPTERVAWLVQEIRLNGNPPERRLAFEGPAAFLTGEW